MSEREIAIELINKMPEYKIGYAVAYLQGLTADEIADDLYCADLLREYQNDSEAGDFVSLDEAIKMCGVDINATQDRN